MHAVLVSFDLLKHHLLRGTYTGKTDPNTDRLMDSVPTYIPRSRYVNAFIATVQIQLGEFRSRRVLVGLRGQLVREYIPHQALV